MTPKPKKKPAKVFIMPPPLYHACGSITLSLPYPPQCLTPNAQRGQSRWAAIAKSRAVKAHRQTAMMAICEAMLWKPYCGEFAGYSLSHFFPTLAFRDQGNSDGSFKAYLDGLCDYFQINDRFFKMIKLSSEAKDATCPRVEVTLWTGEGLNK
jgi:hypothetical protein